MKKATIIIPNYNGLHFLKPCMDALKRQTTQDFDVLIVDNASADGSREWIEENGIPAIFMETNTGFSGAVNAGIKASRTPFVILLNNDTEADAEYVEKLLDAMGDDRIFSASPRMLMMRDHTLMDDAGDMYALLGWAFQRGVGRKATHYEKPCRVFSACAGAAIYRRAVFDEIGLFDEAHFAYLEDMDVGYRANIAGYKNVYVPDAKVLHVGSGTSGSKYNSFKVRLAARNNVYLVYKNMPLMQLIINLPFIAMGFFIKYLFFAALGFGKDYRSGLWEGLKKAGATKKVGFRFKNLKNYIYIEFSLVAGLVIYSVEFIMRHLRGLRRSHRSRR